MLAPRWAIVAHWATCLIQLSQKSRIHYKFQNGNLQLFGKFQPFASQFMFPKCYRNSWIWSDLVFLQGVIIRGSAFSIGCDSHPWKLFPNIPLWLIHTGTFGFVTSTDVVVRPKKKLPVFRVTRPYLNFRAKTRIFFRFPGKKYDLCILKDERPFKLHKIIFFQKKKYLKKYVFLPYLKFSDL